MAVKAAKMTAAAAAAGNEGVYLYRLKLKPSAASALAVVPSVAIIEGKPEITCRDSL